MSRHCAIHRHKSLMCVLLVVFSSLRGGFTHCSASEIPIGYLWQADWPWIFLSPLVVAKRRSFSSLLSKMNQRGEDKSYGQYTPPFSTTKTGQTLLNCRSIFPMTDMTSKLFKLNLLDLGGCSVLILKQHVKITVWVPADMKHLIKIASLQGLVEKLVFSFL